MTLAPPHPPPLADETAGRTLLPGWVLFLRRNRHITVPLAVAPVLWPAGIVLHARHLSGVTLVAGVILSAAIGYFARHKWDRRREQWYAFASAFCASLWLWLAAWDGPLSTETTGLALGASLMAGAIVWGIPWWRHKRPRDKHGSAKLIAEWDAWWQHHCRAWDLGGSAVTDVLLRDVTETLVIQLWAGRQSWRQAQNAEPLIESALRGYIRHGMLRVRVNKHDPSQVHVILRRENPLAEVIGWDASKVPASVTQPAPIGVSESGALIMVCLLVNWFIIGASRKGKSNTLSEMLATLTGVRDARTWLIDRKGGRAARPWLPALDWCAVTIEEARIMLRAAAAEVSERAMNAYDGQEQLQPTEEVPALFVVIDETHEVTSDTRGDTECARLLEPIASMGMGVAVYVIVLTQYGALAESVRTEQVRMNLLNRMCFAVTKPEHGSFALSDWEKLNPARLEAQGEFYWQAGPTADSEPGRGHHMPHDLVRDIAARNGAIPRRPLVLYAADHQQAYDERWSRLPAAFTPLAPQAKAITQPHSPASQEASAVDTPIPPPAPIGARAEAEARAERIEDELAATPDISLAGLGVTDEAVRTQMGQQKRRFAMALGVAPETGISPKQLVIASGMSRSWVHKQLGLLVEAGAVIKIGDGGGAYRQAPGRDAWEAMEAIRQDHDRLLAQATA